MGKNSGQEEVKQYNLKKLGGYPTRERNCNRIGFRAYETYLRSPLWCTIREVILQRDNYDCEANNCNNRANSVHHLAYTVQTLVGSVPGMLASLCRGCHEDCEFECYKEANIRFKLSALGARDKTFKLISGLDKQSKKSNKEIGVWFHDRLFSPSHKITADKIKEKLKSIPGVFERVEEFWDIPPKKIWDAPPITKEIAKLLAMLIKAKYPKFAVISVDKYTTGYRVHVDGPGGRNRIWTEDQVIELQDRFIIGTKRRPR